MDPPKGVSMNRAQKRGAARKNNRNNTTTTTTTNNNSNNANNNNNNNSNNNNNNNNIISNNTNTVKKEVESPPVATVVKKGWVSERVESTPVILFSHPSDWVVLLKNGGKEGFSVKHPTEDSVCMNILISSAYRTGTDILETIDTLVLEAMAMPKKLKISGYLDQTIEIKLDDYTLFGLKAKKLTFGMLTPKSRQVAQCWTVFGTTKYIISFTCAKNLLSSYNAILHEILNSLRYEDATTAPSVTPEKAREVSAFNDRVYYLHLFRDSKHGFEIQYPFTLKSVKRREQDQEERRGEEMGKVLVRFRPPTQKETEQLAEGLKEAFGAEKEKPTTQTMDRTADLSKQKREALEELVIEMSYGNLDDDDEEQLAENGVVFEVSLLDAKYSDEDVKTVLNKARRNIDAEDKNHVAGKDWELTDREIGLNGNHISATEFSFVLLRPDGKRRRYILVLIKNKRNPNPFLLSVSYPVDETDRGKALKGPYELVDRVFKSFSFIEQGEKHINPDPFLVYWQNLEADIPLSIQYDKRSWQTGTRSMAYMSSSSSVTTFTRPDPESVQGAPKVMVAVIIKKLLEESQGFETDLKKFAKQTMEDVEKAVIKVDLQKESEMELNSVRDGRIRAVEREFVADMGKTLPAQKFVHRITVVNGVGILIVIQCKEELWEEQYVEATKVADSFVILAQ